jgi:sphingosine kinase
MTTTSMATDNPFVDPTSSFEDAGRGNSFATDSTLAVGRNASLTLGTDALIVLGELERASRR